MLYVEPLGGLCNRMRTIASYYAAARETGQDLTVVWLRDAGMNCPLHRLFSLPEAVRVVERAYITKPQMRLRSVVRMLTRRAEGRRFDVLFENWQAKKALNTQFIRAMGPQKSLYASSCYSLESAYEQYDYSIFTPAGDILALAQGVTRAFGGNCVGVHIRRTDNEKSIESSRTEDFLRLMRQEIEKDDSVKFFLATDSPEEQRAISEEFPGRVITYAKRSLDRDSEQGIVDAYVDYLCLSQTRRIYGSYYSSFSRCAAALRGIPLDIVTKTSCFNRKSL
jgi:hypothetical protein